MQGDAQRQPVGRTLLQAFGISKASPGLTSAGDRTTSTPSSTFDAMRFNGIQHDAGQPQRTPTRRALDPIDMASTLLCWLQSPGGRTGALSDGELRTALQEMCTALDLDELTWVPVAREFRSLIGDRKRYRTREGRRVRVYHVPPATDNDTGLFSMGAAA